MIHLIAITLTIVAVYIFCERMDRKFHVGQDVVEDMSK